MRQTERDQADQRPLYMHGNWWRDTLRIGRAILSYLVHHEDFLKLILISWQQKSWYLDKERTRVDQYPAWILGI